MKHGYSMIIGITALCAVVTTSLSSVGSEESVIHVSVLLASPTATATDTATLTFTPSSTPTNTPTDSPTMSPTPTEVAKSEPLLTLSAPSWEFNIDGETEGWYPNGQLAPISVSDGLLRTKSTGKDPVLFSPPGLELNAEYQTMLEVRMKVTSGRVAVVFFRSMTDSHFTSSKKIRFLLEDNASFCTYRLDLRSVPGWEGEIDQLRFDPSNVSGAEIEVDYMRVMLPVSEKGPSWEFNRTGDREGWIVNAQLGDVNVSGGDISGIATGHDPFLLSPSGLEVSAEAQNALEIRMRVSEGSCFQVFFKRLGDTSFSASRMQAVRIEQTTEFVEYRVDLSDLPLYTGTISQFRIDPTNQIGSTVDIDYVRVCMPTMEFQPAWTFDIDDEAEGWRSAKDLTEPEVWGGALRTTSTGVDPQLISPSTVIDTRFSRFFVTAMNVSDSVLFNVFFRPITAGGFSAANMKRKAVPLNSVTQVYAVDLGTVPDYEANNVDLLRLDPTNRTGATISIDYMGMLNQRRKCLEHFEFNADGNDEGWRAIKHLTAPVVSRGVLRAFSSGTDPFLFSPNDLFINADNDKNVLVRMKSTVGSVAEFFYKRSTDAGFSATRRKVFSISSHSDFVTYNLDMSSDTNWRGLVDMIRLDPTNASGALIEFDYLRSYGPEQTGRPEWRWSTASDLEGWVVAKDLSELVVSDGLFSASTTGNDPVIVSPGGLSVDASTRKWIVVRMKVTEGKLAEVFYKRTADPNFASLRKRQFDIRSNSEFVTYQLDMTDDPLWTGTVDRLRLDPTTSSGAKVYIDYLLIFQ